MLRRILLFSGTALGQVVYFSVIAFVWRMIGWQSSLAHGVGWLTLIAVCVVNPFLSAYVASLVTRNSGTALTVNLYVLFFSILLICVYANEFIWIHSSGYMNYLASEGPGRFANETLAWNQFFNVLEMAVSGIVFAVSNIVILKRKSERLSC